jgi:hypothetical protein
MDMYGFTVRNWKAELAGFPHEDAFSFDRQRRRVCVADLVTRDFRDGTAAMKDTRVQKAITFGKTRLGMYPNYSPAADICTNAFIETKSLAFANEKIRAYNLKHNLTETDYLARDLAGCTAAGFWEDNGVINYTFICDSRIVIIDNNGKLIFKTADEGPESQGKRSYLDLIVEENGGWENPAARVAIRRDYRNNQKDNYHSFGVLTGEKEAERYIGTGMRPIVDGDYVLAFTDGITDIAFNKENGIEILNPNFSEILIADKPLELQELCQERVNAEGTLVVLKVE